MDEVLELRYWNISFITLSLKCERPYFMKDRFFVIEKKTDTKTQSFLSLIIRVLGYGLGGGVR